MTKLKVFKNQYMFDLMDGIEKNIDRYTNMDENFFLGDGGGVLISSHELVGPEPVLQPDMSSDVDNAIRIFKYLDIDSTMASDPRLWAYLAHTQFCEYVVRRWPTCGQGDSNKIKQRFFLGGGARGLHRHAIARLWWSIKISIAPWVSDSKLLPLKKNDEFYYSRVLMQDESLAADIIERPQLSSSPVLLTCILEFFDRHPELRYRDFYRDFLRGIILTLGYKKLLLLELDEILAELEDIAFDIQQRQKST